MGKPRPLLLGTRGIRQAMSTQGYSYLPESTQGLTVEVMHPNGERRTLPVEAIAATYVSVRWGMSGFYDLNLRVNALTARSVKARTKGSCAWTAVDILAVREMVGSYFDREREARKREMIQHAVSMPHVTDSEICRGGDGANENQNVPLDNRRGKRLP